MKRSIIVAVVVLVLALGTFLLFNRSQEAGQKTDQETNQEQVVLNKTMEISREYASLRYRTDNVLIDAESYADYDAWKNELTDTIKDWEALEKEAGVLENLASEMAQEKVSLKFVETAQAYTKEEVAGIVDKAPFGKKIMTLAKHLGVDAKMAQLILNETQNMISREAYGEEGDVFQTCETRATLVKNASKVTVFVGTIAMTGGTSAIAAGSTLTKAAVIVSGADLTLEITDDTAKMALGNKNKVSALVGDVRKITEPAAAILMVSTLPNNLVLGIDKLNAVAFGAGQLDSAIQSGAVIGIKLPTPTKEKPEQSAEVAVLEKEEVKKWLKEEGVSGAAETVEEIESILMVSRPAESANISENSAQTEKDETKTETQKEQPSNDNNAEAAGLWKGILKHTPSQTSSEKQMEYMVELNNDGTVSATGNGKAFSTWKKEGNAVKLFYKDGSGTYYEFALSGNTLTFTKLAGPNSEGEWQEDFAGEDFFGGKFYEISLKKQ